MSFGFLGIQFGFALQNANVSRIFESLGADVGNLAFYWLAAPLTGLIVQPIIGYLSDNTWTRFGRRRPYFLVGAILASICLLIMPNSPMLWVAVGMLWILDASINISMEPFRAFVGDMLPPEQRTSGFAMQSFFIGVGAVVASALPYIMSNWLGISNVANVEVGQSIPPSVRFSFYIGAVVFFCSVAWTVFRTKEYTPEQLAEFEKLESNQKAEDSRRSDKILPSGRFLKFAPIWTLLGLLGSLAIYYLKLKGELYILSGGFLVFGLIQYFVGHFVRSNKTENGFVIVVNDLFKMPKTMAQLAVVQFFSWFALFSMWIYTTSSITSHVYGTNDTTSELYNQGADWVGVMFASYNGFAALVAFLLPVFAKLTNRRITHMGALFLGGLGLISIYFFKNPHLLIISMFGVGVAWASILSMPYAMLTSSLPAHKMGTYMGIFNFFIVIPQILAASILGLFVTTIAGGKPIYALVLGGFSMFVSAITVLFVDDKDEEIIKKALS